MVKIYKIEEYNKYNKITNDFLSALLSLNESNKNINDKKEIIKKIKKDLNLNFNLIGIFGAGIGAFYPIVESLLSGLSVEITEEVIILATICASTIIYLEEKKDKNFKKQRKLVEDSKNLLQELKLRGVGNGIIKKLVSSFYAFKNLFNIIGKHIGSVASGFIDMFSYTNILIPFMGAIHSVVSKNGISLDNLVESLTGISIGIFTLAAKHTLVEVFKKLKSNFKKIKKNKLADKIEKEVETPIINKFSDTYGEENPEKDTEIIQEKQ